MKRGKVGDIYRVVLDSERERYFQHVGNDSTQLGSDLIKVFSVSNPIDQKLDWNDLASGSFDFCVHVSIALGLKLGCWQRAGNATVSGDTDVMFRQSEDYGNPTVRVSKRWGVWKPNGPVKWIGPLTEHYRCLEIGIVVNPHAIVHRLKTGKYDFFYPE